MSEMANGATKPEEVMLYQRLAATRFGLMSFGRLSWHLSNYFDGDGFKL
jgi:hypothetical protein